MTTRVYFPSTGAAAVSPSVHASWGVSTNLTRRQGVTTRISSTMTEFSGVGDAATGTQVVQQYVIGPLAAQNVSGTIKGQVRVRRANTSGDPGRIAIAVQCVDSAGANALALLAPTYSTQTGTPPNLNLIDSLTNRSFEEGNADYALNLTAQDVPAGGYLVIEVGYKDDTANTSRFVIFSFGDDSATDLAEDRTTTTAGNPWAEFSQTLTFASSGYTLTADQGSFSLTGSTALVDVSMVAAQGSIALTGQDVNLNYGRLLSAVFGSFTFTGQTASLLYSGQPSLSANPRWFPLVLGARLSWLREYSGLEAAAVIEAAGTAGWARPKLYGNIEIDVHSVPGYQRPGWTF